MQRREFIGIAGGTALSLLAGPIALADESVLRFDAPFDGAILHERMGAPVIGGATDAGGKACLRVRVTGTAPAGVPVTVVQNDGRRIPATRTGDKFSAEVRLFERFPTIKAVCSVGGVARVAVTRPVWLRNSFKRYRFQVDDSSFFLRDIYEKDYKSIFDCFWLRGLRKLHVKYGAKFALNCFYSTPEKTFDMSMFSDKYKSQWNDNADWLRLTFHAKNEFPGSPYENATPEELAADFDLVNREIKRFAGNAFSPPGIVHFGTARPESYKVFKDRGVRCLSGYFTKTRSGAWSVSWQLPNDVCEYLTTHDAWYHHESGLVFSRLELVCNTVPLDKIPGVLEASVANPDTAEVLDYLTHEQYFWPYYKNYLPDHFQRIETVVRFASERGYKPVWHNDGFYSVPD